MILRCWGVEQLAARRAHNPKVGGSSPPSPICKRGGLPRDAWRPIDTRRRRAFSEDEEYDLLDGQSETEPTEAVEPPLTGCRGSDARCRASPNFKE